MGKKSSSHSSNLFCSAAFFDNARGAFFGFDFDCAPASDFCFRFFFTPILGSIYDSSFSSLDEVASALNYSCVHAVSRD